MNGRPEDLAPRARQSGLVVRELDGETLIYDRKADKAHCLHATAAAVWRHCDGQTTVADMVTLLSAELGAPVTEHGIYKALSELGKDDLLLDRVADPGKPGTMSRRSMLKRGVAAAVAIPVITTLAVPAGAALASTCTSGCTPGTCNTGPTATGLAHGCCCTATDVCCGGGVNNGCCYLGGGTPGTCGVCTTCSNVHGFCQVNSTCPSPSQTCS